jgi:hypothetical protein
MFTNFDVLFSIDGWLLEMVDDGLFVVAIKNVPWPAWGGRLFVA